MIEEARRYARSWGWAVFPVKGKVPMTANGFKDATREPTDWPLGSTGIGLATGAVSGVVVIDLDSEHAAKEFMAMQKDHGGHIRTVTARTGKGYHVFFRHPGAEVKNSAGKLGEKIDVRGDGGYVVLPPSEHPSGGRYEWVAGRAPDKIDVAPMPSWLISALTETRRALAPVVGDAISEGGRNATLASIAGSMRRRGASEDAIHAALSVENHARCRPPLSDEEVASIARSVARYEPSAEEIRSEVIAELVNGDVLVRMRDEKLAPIKACEVPWDRWRNACCGAGGRRGLAYGWHVVIGAQSGSGKSLFAANMAAHAIRTGEHVCMLSLEMSQIEIMTRLLAIYSGVAVRMLEHGPSFERDVWDMASDSLQEAAGTIRINREPIGNLHQIQAAFEMHVNDGCTVFITDYLQLAWVRSAETMREQITEVSHTIRGLARTHNVVSLGLSQVNRQTSTGGKLQKEGLMGGSSLENDADQVVMLSRPERHGLGFKSEVKLDKNRHGPVTEWEFYLETATLRLKEYEGVRPGV